MIRFSKCYSISNVAFVSFDVAYWIISLSVIMSINAVWACFVDFSHVIRPPPLSDHLVLSLSGELTVQSNLVNMDTEAASILSRDGTRIFQSGFSDSHVRSNWGPKHFGWVPKSWWPSPEKFFLLLLWERVTGKLLSYWLLDQHNQSNNKQTWRKLIGVSWMC